MKIKHIFKIFTIMMMLALTIFTTGCESQQEKQEKYTKACIELEEYHKKVDKDYFKLVDKLIVTKDKEKRVELLKQEVELCKNYEKYINNTLEKMQKIATGNPELEKDIREKRIEYHKAIQSMNRLKGKLQKGLKETYNIDA